MSIKIHHGANGSYKTSGALQDDAVPAILEGRTIITNIRGFTLDRVHLAFPEAPASVDVINLSMESTEDLQKIRSWFQWAPRGAFLIFDETQILFPKSWREKDLDAFDYPGGIEEAKKADRPTGWLDAWTRHRHWNWDVVLTTPNIRYIRDDIRLTCEKAYLHANLAVIGIGGRYKEAMHDAQENRPTLDGKNIVEIKKIKAETFALYESTATGVVTDTRAGKNVFLSPKVLGLLAFIAIISVFVFSSDTPRFMGGQQQLEAGKAGPASSSVPASPGASTPSSVAPRPVAAIKGNSPVSALNHPFDGRTITMTAALDGTFAGVRKKLGVFQVTDSDGRVFRQDMRDLARLGYFVTVRSTCVATFRHGNIEFYVYCPGSSSTSPITDSSSAPKKSSA